MVSGINLSEWKEKKCKLRLVPYLGTIDVREEIIIGRVVERDSSKYYFVPSDKSMKPIPLYDGKNTRVAIDGKNTILLRFELDKGVEELMRLMDN